MHLLHWILIQQLTKVIIWFCSTVRCRIKIAIISSFALKAWVTPKEDYILVATGSQKWTISSKIVLMFVLSKLLMDRLWFWLKQRKVILYKISPYQRLQKCKLKKPHTLMQAWANNSTMSHYSSKTRWLNYN